MKQLAFTLIELAIVLVVIGLVVGGILTGSDLIQAGRIRIQVSQIETLNTALHTFKLKYNCLPGDCASAVAAGLGTSGGDGDNGNGDELLKDYAVATNTINSDESQNFWYHLGQSGLLEAKYAKGLSPGVNSPALKFPGTGIDGNKTGGVWFISSYYFQPVDISFKNTWVFASTVGYLSYGGVYTSDIAYRLDKKIDDGVAGKGNFIVSNGGYNFLCFAAYCQTTVMYTTDNYSYDPQDVPCISETNESGYTIDDPNARKPSATSLCIPFIKAQ